MTPLDWRLARSRHHTTDLHRELSLHTTDVLLLHLPRSDLGLHLSSLAGVPPEHEETRGQTVQSRESGVEVGLSVYSDYQLLLVSPHTTIYHPATQHPLPANFYQDSPVWQQLITAVLLEVN